MKALGFALAALMLAGQATAQPRYDRKLEAAAMAIVAAKIGDLRGGFAIGDKPVMIVVRDDVLMGTTDMDVGRRLAPPEGLARAIERGIDAPAAF